MMMLDEGDRHVVIVKTISHMMVREIMKMLMCIEKHCGMGVVPGMALPPSQGVQRKGRERERERERE